MSGVGGHDMLVAIYSFSRRAVAKKGDGRVIDWLLGSSFAQMYLLYKSFVASTTYGLDAKDLKLTYMQFMCELVCMLLALARSNGYKNRAAKYLFYFYNSVTLFTFSSSRLRFLLPFFHPLLSALRC